MQIPVQSGSPSLYLISGGSMRIGLTFASYDLKCFDNAFIPHLCGGNVVSDYHVRPSVIIII